MKSKPVALLLANLGVRPGARTGETMPTPSIETFRDDPLYPRIARATEQILARGKVVAPVDVLVGMNLLAPKRLEDWRRGRVRYLEKVIDCNLTRLSRLLRILRFHAHDLNLVPSITVYVRRGKGPTQRLQFTKTADPKLEEAYARHFVWPGQRPFHPPSSPRGKQENGPMVLLRGERRRASGAGSEGSSMREKEDAQQEAEVQPRAEAPGRRTQGPHGGDLITGRPRSGDGSQPPSSSSIW